MTQLTAGCQIYLCIVCALQTLSLHGAAAAKCTSAVGEPAQANLLLLAANLGCSGYTKMLLCTPTPHAHAAFELTVEYIAGNQARLLAMASNSGLLHNSTLVFSNTFIVYSRMRVVN